MTNVSGIPEDLAKCLTDLLYGASFFSSAIEINLHLGDIDGEEVEEILRKYFQPKLVVDEEIADELAITEKMPTFDLDKMSWENIKKAASESKWIPPEYCANDWEYDVCEFLRSGAHQPKQAPYAYIDNKNRLVKISGHVYFDGGFIDANSEIPDSWTPLYPAKDLSLENLIDPRPAAEPVDDQGYLVEIDDKRNVYGHKTTTGMAFCFESHGIATRIKLSLEAISAAIALTEKLHDIKFDVQGVEK